MKPAALFVCLLGIGALAADAPASHNVTKADVERWMKELSNWRRWGAGDQMGAVNLITPAKRKAAAALVQDGFVVSLAHDADKTKAPDNSSPYVHRMLATGAKPAGQFVVDEYSVAYHGLAHTHMDALSHMAWEGKMYNGFAQTDVTAEGAKERTVSGTRHTDLSRGPGGVGKEGGLEDCFGRRGVHPDRTMGAPQTRGRM